MFRCFSCQDPCLRTRQFLSKTFSPGSVKTVNFCPTKSVNFVLDMFSCFWQRHVLNGRCSWNLKRHQHELGHTFLCIFRVELQKKHVFFAISSLFGLDRYWGLIKRSFALHAMTIGKTHTHTHTSNKDDIPTTWETSYPWSNWGP